MRAEGSENVSKDNSFLIVNLLIVLDQQYFVIIDACAIIDITRAAWLDFLMPDLAIYIYIFRYLHVIFDLLTVQRSHEAYESDVCSLWCLSVF